MSRLVGLTLAVLTLAGFVARAQEVPLEATDVRGNRHLWLEPLGSAIGLAYTASRADAELEHGVMMLSGGYAHPLDARRALATELFVVHDVTGCEDAAGA